MGSRGTVWNRCARGPEASREGRSGQRRERPGSWGKLSQRQRSRDNPAGRPTGGMTATRPPPSRDNPVDKGCHVTIPPPGDTTRVLANAQEREKLTTHQERLSGSLRAPATGGTTLQARRGCRTAARRRRPVECSNTDPKDQEDLQEERDEELHGPQGSRQNTVYTFRPL